VSDVLRGSLARGVLRLGAPLAIGMALQNAFNLVDAYLIAQLDPGEREAAIGAVGVCDQVAALGTILSYGVSTATATLVAKQKGAGDDAGVRRTVWQSFLLIALFATMFGLLGGVAPAFLVRSMGLQGRVAEVSSGYLRIMVGGSFTIFFALHAASIQRALGSAKTGAALLALGNVLNLVFAVVALYGPRGAWDHGAPIAWLSWGATLATKLGVPAMGMNGAAWATLLARALIAIPMVWVLHWRFRLFSGPQQRSPALKEIRAILSLAWPSSVQFVVRIGLGVFVASLVARYFTTATDQTASTAMGLVFRIDTIALFCAVGWGTAAQTYAAQNLGAHAPERAFKAGIWASAYALLTAVGLAVVVRLFATPILSVFGKEGAAVALGVQYLQIATIGYLPLTLCIALGGTMLGAERARLTLALDAMSLGFAQIPLCWFAAHQHNFERVFQGSLMASTIAAAAYVYVYTTRRWLT
jgi:putative MATE family efflux protein